MKAPLLSATEFNKALQHIETMKRPGHYRLLLLLMRDLGLRPIELARLQSDWFRGGELRIPHGQSKRKKPRTLPVSPAIIEALEAHMEGRQGTVFLNRMGEAFSPGTMGDSITRMYRQAGIQACCYSGRRSMATRLVDQDVNIRVIQQILGHSNLATTAAYCEVSESKMREAMFG